MPAAASRRTSALLAAATASEFEGSLERSLFALSKDAFARSISMSSASSATSHNSAT